MLWGAIVATIAFFYPVSPTAAWLLVPYLAWVSFASALTYSVWRRNRETVSPSPQ
jgi:benzodiazapine receptor